MGQVCSCSKEDFLVAEGENAFDTKRKSIAKMMS
jgi:hypothetical protein